MTRVSLFIDYENIRFAARDIFGGPRRSRNAFGHVNPLQLGLMLTDLGKSVDPERELIAVNVYRGQPGPKSGQRAQAACARQFAAWESLPLVTVRSRPLRYQPTEWSMNEPSAWRAEEKGIDVLMALDIGIGARDDAYDVAVVASADSDLIPAIEVALAVHKRVETAMWWSPSDGHRRMKVPGKRLWNHALDENQFGKVQDLTDYAAEP